MEYTTKQVTIEALQWDGNNHKEILQWYGEYDAAMESIEFFNEKADVENPSSLEIRTLEGLMRANKGDYIIKGLEGEFYPCKASIFEKKYEKVEEAVAA